MLTTLAATLRLPPVRPIPVLATLRRRFKARANPKGAEDVCEPSGVPLRREDPRPGIRRTSLL
jgi:hypothetical protein